MNRNYRLNSFVSPDLAIQLLQNRCLSLNFKFRPIATVMTWVGESLIHMLQSVLITITAVAVGRS